MYLLCNFALSFRFTRQICSYFLFYTIPGAYFLVIVLILMLILTHPEMTSEQPMSCPEAAHQQMQHNWAAIVEKNCSHPIPFTTTCITQEAPNLNCSHLNIELPLPPFALAVYLGMLYLSLALANSLLTFALTGYLFTELRKAHTVDDVRAG